MLLKSCFVQEIYTKIYGNAIHFDILTYSYSKQCWIFVYVSIYLLDEIILLKWYRQLIIMVVNL